MVEQQIRTWEVLDQEVLDLLFALRREDFVPAQYRSLAFVDMEIPLAEHATADEKMLAPKLESRCCRACRQSVDRVLEVGTGSGYMTRCSQKRGAHVYSVEIVPQFSAQAAVRLRCARHSQRDARIGMPRAAGAKHAPYDAIVLTARCRCWPMNLRAAESGGRLLAMVVKHRRWKRAS